MYLHCSSLKQALGTDSRCAPRISDYEVVCQTTWTSSPNRDSFKTGSWTQTKGASFRWFQFTLTHPLWRSMSLRPLQLTEWIRIGSDRRSGQASACSVSFSVRSPVSSFDGCDSIIQTSPSLICRMLQGIVNVPRLPNPIFFKTGNMQHRHTNTHTRLPWAATLIKIKPTAGSMRVVTSDLNQLASDSCHW